MNVAEKLPVTQTGGLTPMEMLRIAVERGDDLDKLERLMDLNERWEQREARKEFIVALSEFKTDPPTVMKNKRAEFGAGNKSTAYEYATLANVANIIAPALSRHGLSHRWTVEQSEAGLISVTCTLTHSRGHSESVTLRGPIDSSGSKNAIQAIGSTVTYLERYTLLAITGLAAMDQDSDGAGRPIITISADQKDQLIDLMKETSADTAKFLTYLGVATLDELPATMFDQAISALERKRSSK